MMGQGPMPWPQDSIHLESLPWPTVYAQAPAASSEGCMRIGARVYALALHSIHPRSRGSAVRQAHGCRYIGARVYALAPLGIHPGSRAAAQHSKRMSAYMHIGARVYALAPHSSHAYRPRETLYS